MIEDVQYLAQDGVGLASLIGRGELQVSEVLEAALRRAELVNPRLNAVVIPMFELARERAAQPLEGPFAGVPFLIKDLFQDYAGVTSSSGNAALRRAQIVATRHSEIVARWLRAGTVIFGRTNSAEFGAKAVTEPRAWGPTRNPWNLAHTPGGSSGGAAAAVSAGIVPMAGASDGGGSIRIPAACTGLFGFKPGRGRNPTGPGVLEPVHGAAVNHVVTRSVRDSACMLDATHGSEPGGVRLAAPEVPYTHELTRDPRKLRIAFSSVSPLGSDVHPDAVRAVEDAARLLMNLGHDVEEAVPELDGRALARDFCTVWFAHLAANLEYTRKLCGAKSREFELDALAMEAIARSLGAPAYVEAHMRWSGYCEQLAAFWSHHDVLMTPSLALRPPLVGHASTPAWAERAMRLSMPLGLSSLIPLAADTIEQVTLENLGWAPFTQLANVTGVPAMTVPLASFGDGLPLGVHFMADHGAEGMLFSLAGQLERAVPWRDKRPPL